MKPISLSWSNVHRYLGDHALEFDGLRLVGVSGPNGAGKSTALVDVPLWALFRKTRAGGDSIVAPGADRARAEFVFDLGADRFRVVRHQDRKKSMLSFCRQSGERWEPLDGASIPETQARIEEMTGLTYDLATRTIWSVQNEADKFATDAPADRKATFLRCLDADWWEERAQKARKGLQALGAEVTILTSRAEERRADAEEAEGLKATVAEIAARLKRFEADLQVADKALKAAENARAALQAAHAAVKAREDQLERLKAAVDDNRTSERELRLELQTIGKRLGGAAEVADKIAKAEEARKTADAEEQKRQADERLLAEAETVNAKRVAAQREHAGKVEAVADRMEGAQREHRAAVQTLADKIAASHREHAQKVERLEAHLDSLTAQVEVMDEVPCTHAPEGMGRGCEEHPALWFHADYPNALRNLSATCPLLEMARKAQADLPAAREAAAIAKAATPWTEDEERLAALEEETPWTADERALANLRAESPGKPFADRLEAIEKERNANGYDRLAHQAAEKLAATLPELQKRQTALAGDQARREEAQKRLDALMLELGKAVGERDEAAKDPDLKRDWEMEVRSASYAVQDADKHLGELRGQISEEQRQEAATKEQLGRAEAAAIAAEELTRQLSEVRAQQHRLTVLEASCGRRGLPQWIIEGCLPQFEDAANDFLADLSDGQFALSLVTQTETKKGGVTETLDVVVSDSDGSRPLETFSGGERVKINLALRMGLTALVSQRAGVQLRMAVLDEPSDGLSDDAIEALVECLGRIGKRLELLAVVSHDTRLRDRFEQRIVVSRGADGGSRLEVLA